MAIDFPLPPLRRFLWDHLSEIVSPDEDQHRLQPRQPSSGFGSLPPPQQHQQQQLSPDSTVGSGVSGAWAAGTGHEGFDGFRIELKKFSSGQSNPTFLLVVHRSPPPAAAAAAATKASRTGAGGATPGGTITKYVLRKKPASVTVSSAHAVEREFRILRALRRDPASNVPVPRALLLCEDASVIGTPFYVMEFVEGRIFSDAALPGLDPAERTAVYESAAETLARLHRVDFARAGLGGFGRETGGYLGRQVATLEKVARKQAEDAGPISGFGEIVRDLGSLIASGDVVPDRVTIVHGDFRIDNLVYHPVEPHVVAVLDWELSTLGHPLADLANLCILHHLPASGASSASASASASAPPGAASAVTASTGVPDGRGGRAAAAPAAAARTAQTKRRNRTPRAPPPAAPSPLAGLKGLDLEALGIPQQSELMAAYRRAASARPGRGGGQSLAGLAGPGVAELGLAFVFFKMAVIAHGVKARLSRGVASSSQASLVSAMVPTMIALAEEQISALGDILSAEGLARRKGVGDEEEDSGGDGGGGSAGGAGGEAGGGRPVKAVLFDVGGVLSESPLLAISQFEREARPTRLPPSYIGVAIAAAGEGGLFQRLERGEERLGDRFLERFEEYLVSAEAKRAYVNWCVGRRRATGRSKPSPSPPLSIAASQSGGRTIAATAPQAASNFVAALGRRSDLGDSGVKEEAEAAVAGVVAVDTLELFRRITAAARVPVPPMIAFAEALRPRGFKVGVVSNDFKAEPGFVLGLPTPRPHEGESKPGAPQATATAAVAAGAGAGRDDGDGSSCSGDSSDIGGSVYSRLPAMCDVVVLSSTAGSRKPNPEIYENACQALGVSPREAVFVDDIRENIRAAETLGMRTVWVASGGSVAAAISELEAMTGTRRTASTPGFGGVRQPPGKL